MSAAFRGKSKYGMGEYSRTPEEEEARLWCHENDICVTPRAIKSGERKWVIDIEKGKYPNRKLLGTSQEYGPTTIWKKIAEYQKYYYDKYKNT